LIRILALLCVVALCGPLARAQDSSTDTRPGIAPDIRDDDSELKVQRGNFVVVPIPISNPTLDTGLVVGGAYFYPQTEEQKKQQPASLTALGGLYTSNDSRAVVIAQQNYWRDDRWRFTGAIGAADLRLSLLAPDDTSSGTSVDWRINGQFLFAKLSRRLQGDWYGGVFTRVVNADQSINTAEENQEEEFELGNVKSVGLGAVFEYDSRDSPFYSTNGSYFKLDALLNDESIGSDATYQSYSGAYRSYHKLSDSVVLAWEIQGCKRGGTIPLWDACTIKLRGFSVTDYLGKVSASSQAEARWQLSPRWGLVGFAGVGYFGSSFNDFRSRESIPSYGAGIRFNVLKSKHINLRLDFARSRDDEAIHVSVGEAF
jgi:outer membrane protein assembly factor BamA